MKPETKITLSPNQFQRIDKLIKKIVFSPKYRTIERANKCNINDAKELSRTRN